MILTVDYGRINIIFMKKVLTILTSLFFFLILHPFGVEAAILTCSDSINGKAILSEFSSATTSEWIELLNTDQNNSINLTNCNLKDGNNTTLKSLSGTLPRGGFLTFTLDAGSLSDTGGIIRLTDASSTSLSALSYGTNTSITTITAPNSSQSGYYNQSISSWATGSSTKGWCNPGTTGCPTIATMVSSMNAFGVSTNLDSQSDYSRTSGLYFQKSETTDPNGTPMGKITFLSEINFTDRDALTWMQSLDSSIDMSTRGKIGLNADLIANLVSTNAQLTMYGLTYSNPTVDVTNTNGSAGDSSIVSSLSYSNGALTFTAAHFTTFTAREISSGTSAPITPGCGKELPNKAPNLFQIDTAETSAKLFFSPVNNAVDHYYIAYGLSEGDERYGAKFDQGYYDGVLNYTIKELSPNTQYYFKVRAGNGCAPGSWSSTLSAKTEGGVPFNNKIEKRSKTTTEEESEEVEVTPTVMTNQPITDNQQPTIKLSLWQKLVNFILNLFR